VWRPRNALARLGEEATGYFLPLVHIRVSLASWKCSIVIMAVVASLSCQVQLIRHITTAIADAGAGNAWRHVPCRTYRIRFAPSTIANVLEYLWAVVTAAIWDIQNSCRLRFSSLMIEMKLAKVKRTYDNE
jgi:hypothetical protein